MNDHKFESSINTYLGGYSIHKGDLLFIKEIFPDQLFLLSEASLGLENYFAIVTPVTINELAGHQLIYSGDSNVSRPPIFIRYQ